MKGTSDYGIAQAMLKNESNSVKSTAHLIFVHFGTPPHYLG